MLMKLQLAACLALALFATAAGCKTKEAATPASHENTPENLQKLWQQVVSDMKAGKAESALDLVKTLMPDENAAREALVPNIDGALLASMMSHYGTLKAQMNPEKAGRGFKTERDQVTVHGATTEQIAEGAQAATEFPGGAQRVAKTILRPGLTFYEVELTEPGKDAGTKFHLLYWDGAQWRMLGAVWQATR
jgi:hypothetical protein